MNKLIIIILLAFPIASYGQNIEVCPQFSLNKHNDERNVVEAFYKTHKDKYKSKVYIALNDLNSDGKNEILTYIDGVRFCGNKTGCYFNVFTTNGKKLVKYGIPTFFKVNKSSINNQSYLCVLKEKNNNWKNLLVSNQSVRYFNGKVYKGRK